MSDFGTFIDNLQASISSPGSGVEDFLRLSTIRGLKALGRWRVHFMEDTFSFASVADQQEYGTSDTDFPQDVAEFNTIYTQTDNVNHLIEIVSIGQIRSSGGNSSNLTYPTCVAFHHRKLVFPYPLAAGVTIYGDYQRDATRDATTGNVIVSTDETTANAWFDEGEDALRAWVLADFYGSFRQDYEQAVIYKGFLGSAREDLKRSHSRLRNKGFQPQSYGL